MNAANAVTAATQRGLAADAKTLDALNGLAGRDPKAALKETARQFEALFMRELLKSMRDATMKSGLMDNDASELGMDLLDEQWAVKMTGLPGGLAEMIERQLQRQMAHADGAAGGRAAAAAPSTPSSAVEAPVPKPTPAQVSFIQQHRVAAQQVARESGIPAAFMIGQAAHETGWGRSEIRLPDGRNSHNLFGIKAGPGWTGKVAEVTTTEYVDGQPRKVVQRFRAYDSYADAFRDYARLITGSPRYQAVVRNLHSAQAFAQQLQQAGYATDPQYATKLSRVINTTLQLQRALA
ncbi:flagellar assembly peptidoglycan hydrolase FlgJ [Tepidimonas taiwanensis]|uniref:Peptidoglycan hydrolase FlgJ n=1 Tax=Tepidimonas taiwanensis TaxID=307486 RepID=A0A554XCE3_9BURK|nr:flagellar assembly peptidoglycan hydrolase FlgJ [Tepidimonas taiwanensis]MCX7693284.1 flagellar assembly peptidoglycan hydrolase FlgJ [Tepidimonas taiwanensis]MDM7464213.1 flagellar assembly peptidoglycan hydrolase FlgJ [Tepidimonas taiwanensis]TSE33515.1 Peptidoglycan hydrolase FlgJ [Tepidimonas taiwanensis]UBQ05783.1 flagellar assembly peptidoglycan hydrolase FlgJ [Tepidimonas taiwanensis]